MGDLPHKIVIEPTSIRGERGQYYRVHFQGAVLLDEVWNPELDACRALVARGVTGRLEVWRFGKAHPDMLIRDITKAAEWTVVENENHGPRFARWRPLPEQLSQNASSRAAGLGANGREACEPPNPSQKETEPAE